MGATTARELTEAERIASSSTESAAEASKRLAAHAWATVEADGAESEDGWPHAMEDVFHRVSHLLNVIDYPGGFVTTGDALAVDDVQALLNFAGHHRRAALAAVREWENSHEG